MDAGTESVEWVTQEFARADLGDQRLDRRLAKTAEQLAKSPASPINEACGNWASTQAAYRLFNNPVPQQNLWANWGSGRAPSL